MSSVQMTRSDSILDVVDEMQRRIAARAYDMFKSRGVAWGDAWEDWFAAEREVIRKPAVELSEKDGSYTVLASLAGVEPKRLHVSIAPQDLAITAEDAHSHTAKERQVHECDFRAGSVFPVHPLSPTCRFESCDRRTPRWHVDDQGADRHRGCEQAARRESRVAFSSSPMRKRGSRGRFPGRASRADDRPFVA